MLNSFSGIGRLGADPVVIQKNGTAVATFDVAINEFYKQDNDLKKRTHWIPCVAFGRLAEIAGEFLRKGSQIGIRGPLHLSEWNGDKGKKQKKLQVHVNEFEFLSARQTEEPEGTTEQVETA